MPDIRVAVKFRVNTGGPHGVYAPFHDRRVCDTVTFSHNGEGRRIIGGKVGMPGVENDRC